MDGVRSAGGTLLLHAEQGFGDTIQFVRYAAHDQETKRSSYRLVECQRPLAKLLAACPGIDRLVRRGTNGHGLTYTRPS